jgi:hypothetical protein
LRWPRQGLGRVGDLSILDQRRVTVIFVLLFHARYDAFHSLREPRRAGRFVAVALLIPRKERVRQADNFVRENIGKFSQIAETSSACVISTRILGDALRRVRHRRPVRVLNDLRLKEARRLLCSAAGPDTVTEAAPCCGITPNLAEIAAVTPLSAAAGFAVPGVEDSRLHASGIAFDAARGAFWITSDVGRSVFLWDGRSPDLRFQLRWTHHGKSRAVHNAEGVASAPDGRGLRIVSDDGKDSRFFAYALD